MNLFAIILFTTIALAAAGLIGFKFIQNRALEKRKKWNVPLSLLNDLLPEAERRMIKSGFGKADYIPGIKDCSDFSPKWADTLEPMLKPYRPKNQTEWMKIFSFQRDLRPDGSNPGRHQVLAIRTDAGLKYIDTYRIGGTLFRNLSETEIKNGQWR